MVPGCVAGVDCVTRGQEKLCLTSETELTWHEAWESSSLVYARMLCVCQSEGERGRSSEAAMRGKETMWVSVCVCVGKQKREISSYTCRTMSCVFVRTSSCMTVYWLCKAITARSDRVDTHRVIVRESCGFHLIPESQINKLKSCPIRTRSNKLHRYLRRWVCLPAHQSTHHKGIHTHMDTS